MRAQLSHAVARHESAYLKALKSREFAGRPIVDMRRFAARHVVVVNRLALAHDLAAAKMPALAREEMAGIRASVAALDASPEDRDAILNTLVNPFLASVAEAYDL